MSALGSKSGKSVLFNKQDGSASSHGSLYANVLTDLHRYSDLTEISVPVTTLDEYCHQNSIEHIDFAKIDTEGHEKFVLEGARTLIKEGRIGAIQFEFNEMNVISRVFLRDFFEILAGWNFYRLDTRRLISLNYKPSEELFVYQNIFVTRDSLPIEILSPA